MVDSKREAENGRGKRGERVEGQRREGGKEWEKKEETGNGGREGRQRRM